MFWRVPVDCAVCGWGVSMSKGFVEVPEGVMGASCPWVAGLVERGVREREARRELSRGDASDREQLALPPSPSRTSVSTALSKLPLTPFRIATLRELSLK